MASILAVSKYILEQRGEMTSMKLQKLAYYSQAWSLVWDEEPVIDEAFQAWANGPVCPELFQVHKGKFKIGPRDIDADTGMLTDNQRDSIDKVLSFYGDKTAQWLSDLTHREDPWVEAREGTPAMERSTMEIGLDKMHIYYSSL